MPSLKNSSEIWCLLLNTHWNKGVYKRVKKNCKIYSSKKGHYLIIERKRYYINILNYGSSKEKNSNAEKTAHTR